MYSKLHVPFLPVFGPCLLVPRRLDPRPLLSAFFEPIIVPNIGPLYVVLRREGARKNRDAVRIVNVRDQGDQSEYVLLPELRGARPNYMNPVLLC